MSPITDAVANLPTAAHFQSIINHLEALDGHPVSLASILPNDIIMRIIRESTAEERVARAKYAEVINFIKTRDDVSYDPETALDYFEETVHSSDPEYQVAALTLTKGWIRWLSILDDGNVDERPKYFDVFEGTRPATCATGEVAMGEFEEYAADNMDELIYNAGIDDILEECRGESDGIDNFLAEYFD